LADYYGDGLSLSIEGVGRDAILVCDLSDDAATGAWAHTPPPAGRVAVDPVLGRIAFPGPQAPPPRVTFHYGFWGDVGGGEYERAATFQLPAQPVDAVPESAPIQAAIDGRTPGRAIEIEGNGRHEGALSLVVNPGERFELRAANSHRPTVVLAGDLLISGGDERAEVTLSGLLIVGGAVHVTGALGRLRLLHCTLVPGVDLDTAGLPTRPDEPSLVVDQGGVTVEIDHCVLGGVRWHDLSTLEAADSVIDATRPGGVALAGPGAAAAGDPAPPGGALRLEECTVIGKVHVRVAELVSNSLLVGEAVPGDGWPAPVLVDRRQSGCFRFSFVPDDARTPRRYRCQPDLEAETRVAAAARAARAKGQSLSDAQRAAIRGEVVPWLKPAFTSLRYGDPGYAQLRSRSPDQIRRGADDEAAMGATHDVFEPQRLANLRIRLDEYLRFGLEAGVFAAT
jgi:hypothetical protein